MRDIANEIAAENERLKRAEGTWRAKGKFVSDCTETLAGMHAIYDEEDNFVAAFLFPEARDRAVKAVNHLATERAEWIDLSAGLLSAAQAVLHAWEQSEKHNPANVALWLNGPIGELYGAVIDLDRKAATSTNEGKR